MKQKKTPNSIFQLSCELISLLIELSVHIFHLSLPSRPRFGNNDLIHIASNKENGGTDGRRVKTNHVSFIEAKRRTFI